MSEHKTETFAAMRAGIEGRWSKSWPSTSSFGRLHSAMLETLRATDEFLAHSRSLQRGGKFSPQGLREELREYAAQKTIIPIHRAVMAAQKASDERRSTRASLVVAKADPADLSSALLRGEMRTWLRSLSSAEKMQFLTASDISEHLLLAAMEAPPAMIGLTPDMLKQVQQVAIEGKFETELNRLDEMQEAIELTDAAVGISIFELRERTGFGPSDDIAFNKWMAAASARIPEALANDQPHVSASAEAFSADIAKTFDEIWAKAFPKLYPNHPVNRPG